MPTSFRQELIDSVATPEGRQMYADTLAGTPSIVGCEAEITGLNIRVIKGINRLALPAAAITPFGIATEDSQIIDCSAAIVQKQKDGSWKRFSGKDSAHVTRLFPDYDPSTKEFSLWAEGDEGIVVPAKRFPASALAARPGKIIQAKFSKEIVDGVLEDGPITEHIRQCLSAFMERVDAIGVLVRHPRFYRPSDTRTPSNPLVQTLYTDGAQIHTMNQRTVEWQNETIARKMALDNYRGGLEFSGESLPPNGEDLAKDLRIMTQDDGDVIVTQTGLTPRCLMTQRHLKTGSVEAEPKLWNGKHRPIRPDGLMTMGGNADVMPEFEGAVIRLKDRIVVESEKTDWKV